MSTHAIVGRYEDQRGRFVGFDGYPTGVGCELVDLIRRDGIENVMNVILDAPEGWSFLDASYEEEGEKREFGGGNLFCVCGYGEKFSDDDVSDFWVDVANDRKDIVWAYMVMGDGDIVIYQNGRNVGVVSACAADAKVSMQAIYAEYMREA